jgi:CHAT domain-containing protein
MRLPFAALVGPSGRYLVEDYSIAYVPAGALLDFTSSIPHPAPGRRRFLLVADPTLAPPLKGESPLPLLPGARDEVRAIATLAPSGATVVLEGPRADEKAVSAAMREASVLHFATHGITNDQVPLDSYLALGRPAAGGDGRLTAQEIYGFTLNADLVVLSSCRSAGGTPTGEGIAALARAFFYAGAPSIVASVWDVPDQPANRLFTPLYAAWLRDGSPADALRAAQLKLIADLRAGRVRVRTAAGEVVLPESPILWAGFVVLGEP